MRVRMVARYAAWFDRKPVLEAPVAIVVERKVELDGALRPPELRSSGLSNARAREPVRSTQEHVLVVRAWESVDIGRLQQIVC